jgi:hypothetical protein
MSKGRATIGPSEASGGSPPRPDDKSNNAFIYCLGSAANLPLDADAWKQIRKTNDQVKAQGKHDPEVLVTFKPLLDLFARVRPAPTSLASAPNSRRGEIASRRGYPGAPDRSAGSSLRTGPRLRSVPIAAVRPTDPNAPTDRSDRSP